MRNVQHKKEAYWFYRFLSIFYDNYVNPFFWTERMREEALELVDWEDGNLEVVDVGSGTGFTTQGIVRRVPASNVTCIDQSPHQMSHAKQKHDLNGCTFRQGDAEDLPFETDRFDRYVSAGSIEYWPEPQRGIAESYRVIKPGGEALMIGPLRPQHPIARWSADTWMLFPEEREYIDWYEKAGFTNIRKRYVTPSWVRNEPYGIALVGTKPKAGESPVDLPPVKKEDVNEPMSFAETVGFATRLIVGTLAGGLTIPIAIYGYAVAWLKNATGQEKIDLDPLTPQQKRSLTAIAGLIVFKIWRRGSK